MPSLSEHLERHDRAVGPLAFRRDCPLCRAERVAGHLPSATVAPLRACAAVTAALLAAGAVAPSVVVAADGQGFAAQPPESPPAPHGLGCRRRRRGRRAPPPGPRRPLGPPGPSRAPIRFPSR